MAPEVSAPTIPTPHLPWEWTLHPQRASTRQQGKQGRRRHAPSATTTSLEEDRALKDVRTRASRSWDVVLPSRKSRVKPWATHNHRHGYLRSREPGRHDRNECSAARPAETLAHIGGAPTSAWFPCGCSHPDRIQVPCMPRTHRR
jgi:hypothetical protein